jgi:hypothetical protein
MIQSIIEILEQMKIGITDGEPSINGADMYSTAEQLEQLFHKHAVSRSCGDTIEDGFGGVWSKRCPMCGRNGMQVMRPGKVQCRYCG